MSFIILQYIPTDFARNNGLNKRVMVDVIDANGRKWVLPFRYSNRKAYIGGWRKFHLANGLKTGDNFTLELIHSKEDLVIKFHTKVTYKLTFLPLAKRKCT